MNNQTKELSIKQRQMLLAYHASKRELDWPKLECAMSMLKLGQTLATAMVCPRPPNNTPAG